MDFVLVLNLKIF